MKEDSSAPLNPLSAERADTLHAFFDFFNETVDDVYAYILHCSRIPEATEELALSVYYALFQRRRFLFWKNVTQLQTALAIADKAIASLSKWEEAKGSSYLDTLLHCIPSEQRQETKEHMRALLRALRELSPREHRLAIIMFFLRWPVEKTTHITGKDVQSTKAEYEHLEHILGSFLTQEPSFEQTNIHEFLMHLQCLALSEEKKTSLRKKLLERCNTTPMSSLRFAQPVGTFMLVAGSLVGCVLFVSTFLMKPLSLQDSLEQIAAVEVLLLEEEIAVRDALIASEKDLTSIAAYAALKDVSRISLSLASLALEEQLQQEKTLGPILEKLGEPSPTLHSLSMSFHPSNIPSQIKSCRSVVSPFVWAVLRYA